MLSMETWIASFLQIYCVFLRLFFFLILALSPSAENNARKVEFASFLARKETSHESLICLQAQIILNHWGADKSILIYLFIFLMHIQRNILNSGKSFFSVGK